MIFFVDGDQAREVFIMIFDYSEATPCFSQRIVSWTAFLSWMLAFT